MKSFFPFLLVLMAVVNWSSAGAAQNLSPKSGGLIDFVDVAQGRSERNHAFAARGSVQRQITGDYVGGHDMKRMARVVSGAGSWVSYRLKVQPNVPLTLEVEEIEPRSKMSAPFAVRAYSLWVDGKRTYFRTAPSTSAGPLHFFVSLPAQNKNFVELKLQNESEVPFHLSRVWVFADFSRFFERAGMAVPYHLAPTIALSFGDKAADAAKLRSIKTSFGDHPRARPAWTTWVNYGNLSDTELAQKIDYIVELAQEVALPVQICLDTWWGSTPNGSDGKGGFWSDVEYQQVVYNQTQGYFQLSVPNQWGNTPWLSVNHPNLNAFKTERIGVAMRMLQDRYATLRAMGNADLILAVNLDNEPVYWASGNAGLSSGILQADFGAAAIEAARRDNITLNPQDGLNFGERKWLWRNLLNYQQLIAGAAAGAGGETIRVDAAGVHPSRDPLRDNLYSQAFVANAALQFPMQNAAYPLWETGAPISARVGGEWNGDSRREREAVLHQLPLGRTAQVNAETGKRVTEIEGVRPGYALGQRYYALYNYPLDKMDVAGSVIRDTPAPLEPILYERVLREETFVDDTWKSRVAEHEGLERELIGYTTAMALRPSAGAKQGHLTYRLDSPKNQFEGLKIELSGRAFVSQSKNPNVYIRVLAGPTPNVASMREFGRISDDGDINAIHRFDLSDAARGQKSIFVRLELNATDLPPTVMSWCSIYHLRFTQPWPADLTQNMTGEAESIEVQRQQNLLVSWRRDAELAIERLDGLAPVRNSAPSHFVAEALQVSRGFFARGEYASAYRRATHAWQMARPGAKYHVVAPGRLDPYPISVRSAAPVTLTLHSWKPGAISFALKNDASQANNPAATEVEFADLGANQSYSLLPGQTPQNWLLRRSLPSDGPTIPRLKADATGKARWTMVVSADEPRATKNRVLQGTFRALWSQDPPLLSFWREDRQGFERVAVTEKTRIVRGEPGQETNVAFDQLARGDAITVSYDEAGVATQVVAGTRLIEGVVAEAAPLTPYAMPFIRFEGEAGRHIVDISAPLSLGENTTSKGIPSFRSVPLGTIRFKAGDRLKVRLNPRSGRIFEVWKIQPEAP